MPEAVDPFGWEARSLRQSCPGIATPQANVAGTGGFSFGVASVFGGEIRVGLGRGEHGFGPEHRRSIFDENYKNSVGGGISGSQSV
jgi:hypothetical protein